MVQIRTRSRPVSPGSAGSTASADGQPTQPPPASDDASESPWGSDVDGFGDTSADAQEQALQDEAAAALGVDDRTVIDEVPAPARTRTKGKPGRKPRTAAERAYDKAYDARRAASRKAARDEASVSASSVFGDAVASPIDHKLMVRLLLTMLEGMAVPQIGEHARFEPDERRLIEPALSNILERMTPDAAKAFSRFADPAMLAVGLLVWGTRVFSTPRRPVQPGPRPTPIRPEQYQAPATPAAPAGTVIDGSPESELADTWSGGAI